MMMTVTVWYCPLIITRRVTPPPATWIIGSIAMNISAWSYYMTGRSWIDNIVVYTAAFEIVIVTGVLLTSLYRHQELVVSFDWVQKVSLASMAAILTYWYFNRDAAVTFVTTQTLMVVAYIPTVVKGFRLKKAFDSIGNWGWISASAMVGGVIPFLSGNQLAQLASLRAVITSGITIGVFLYYDRRNGWSQWEKEVRALKEFYRIS